MLYTGLHGFSVLVADHIAVPGDLHTGITVIFAYYFCWPKWTINIFYSVLLFYHISDTFNAFPHTSVLFPLWSRQKWRTAVSLYMDHIRETIESSASQHNLTQKQKTNYSQDYTGPQKTYPSAVIFQTHLIVLPSLESCSPFQFQSGLPTVPSPPNSENLLELSFLQCSVLLSQWNASLLLPSLI